MKKSFLMSCGKALLIVMTIGMSLAAKAIDDADQTSTESAKILQPNYLSYDRLGVGIKWGTLTGVSAKYWADDFQAVEVTAAFADSNTVVGIDYLWNFRGAVASLSKFNGADNFIPFVGVGLLSSFGTNPSNTRIFNHDTDNFNLAARVPLGIEYLPSSVHLGIFGEIGLGLGFVTTSYTFATADLGARYYF